MNTIAVLAWIFAIGLMLIFCSRLLRGKEIGVILLSFLFSAAFLYFGSLMISQAICEDFFKGKHVVYDLQNLIFVSGFSS